MAHQVIHIWSRECDDDDDDVDVDVDDNCVSPGHTYGALGRCLMLENNHWCLERFPEHRIFH